MKYIISCLCLIVIAIGTTEAQSEFDALLETQQQYQVIYTKERRPANRRKLHKAEKKLISYLKEEGYEWKVRLREAAALPIYGGRYPNLGEVVGVLANDQQIKVFGKDKYGYYKVHANGEVGYVYKLEQHVTHFDNYPLALVNRYIAIETKVDALLSQPVNHYQRKKSSAPYQTLNRNGQYGEVIRRNPSEQGYSY